MRLLIFAVILSLAAIACSPTTSKCDPTNCATCCTSQGQCVLSVGAASCGSSGSLCATCIGGQSCSNGICTASQGAGGGSGAGGGGAAGGGSSDTATVVGTLGFAVRSSAWVNDPLAEANYLMLADTVANNCPERTSKRAPLAPDREALIFQLGAGNSLHSGTYVIDNAGGANQVSAFRVRYAAGIVTTVATANTGGSLTISNLTATSLSGTFSITLPAAGALTGSFALAAPCSTKGALGDDCFDDTDCTTGLRCDTSTSMCAGPKMNACNALTQNCTGGKSCVVAYDGFTICVPPGTVATGDFCLPEVPGLGVCLANAQCVDNTCRRICNRDGGTPACASGSCSVSIDDAGVGGCR